MFSVRAHDTPKNDWKPPEVKHSKQAWGKHEGGRERVQCNFQFSCLNFVLFSDKSEIELLLLFVCGFRGLILARS